jgi:hypothetical protein
MSWLATGENAAAVQAASAIVTAVLTFVLAVSTMKYVRLTRRLATIAHGELTANLRPELSLDVGVTEVFGMAMHMHIQSPAIQRTRNLGRL